MPRIPVVEQQTTPSGQLVVRSLDTGGGELVRGLDTVGRNVQGVAGLLMQRAEQDDMLEASQRLAEMRVESAGADEGGSGAATPSGSQPPHANAEAADATIASLRKRHHEARGKMKTRRGQMFLEGQYHELMADHKIRAMDREAKANFAYRGAAQERSVDTAAVAVEADPASYAKAAAEQLAVIDALLLPEADKAERRQRTVERLSFGAAIGRAKQDPGHVLEQLAKASPDDPMIAGLSPEGRLRLQGLAEDNLERSSAEGILAVYRGDVRAGDRALAELEDSTLPPERLDGIRRRVREGVGLLRDERQAQYMDRIARLDVRIAAGASVSSVQSEAATLYRQGAISPAQYSAAIERAGLASVRMAEASAVQREVAETLRAGAPLDPQNAKHREFLATAFDTDTQRLKAGSPEWQAVALGYAGRARMLPTSAASWLRAAARSPDAKLATSAAEFYGSLEQTSPEAAGDVDADSRAFLASLAGMLEAGAQPQAAFETARSNVFEARRDVIEARTAAYKDHARTTEAALGKLIDRDFDPGLFTREPSASVALRSDFDRQAAQYFRKVGDIELARELAWRDVTRIYGPTRVNGAAVVTAFPVERFGVSPEEVRSDVAAFLAANPREGLTVDDVLVVPDGVTLRSVSDAYAGTPVMPSYRLVTTQGDLVTDADGVPVRYTLPTRDELTRRTQAAQVKARQQAELAVAEAKRRREALEERELQQATSRLPVGPKE